jgi:hypothetical protein
VVWASSNSPNLTTQLPDGSDRLWA